MGAGQPSRPVHERGRRLNQPAVARVLPDVTGLDKSFDYLVPREWRHRVEIGDVVRVDLNGRRVRGWVVELDPGDARATAPLVKWSGRGPDHSLVELADWASVRWAAGRLRPFLVTATAPSNVTTDLPEVQPTASDRVVEAVRLGPTRDPLPVVLDRVAGRAALVIHPSVGGAAALARRLTKTGLRTALWPEQWAAAASGVDVVVGTRAAAWARLPRLEVAVVLDEHDEALQSERTPTWHARDVLARRMRSGRLVLVSPSPSVAAIAVATGAPTAAGSMADERSSWPAIEVIDRTSEPPWQRSLLSSELIAALRDADRRVVVVSNAPGRARILACRVCRALQRCSSCGAAVHQGDDGRLGCGRCATIRPAVCQACGSTALANVRPGVTRLREELEAAAGRPVAQVTGDTGELPDAGVYVGTEAVLHRVGRVDVVAFADFDAELLAPRYRAAEQAMTLLIRAGRLVGDRSGTGRVLVHTRLPDHPVLVAARTPDVAHWTAAEQATRRLLALPPYGALAAISGGGHADFAAAAAEVARATGDELVAVSNADRSLVRGTDWIALGRALVDTPRPSRSRLRVEVDPPR